MVPLIMMRASVVAYLGLQLPWAQALTLYLFEHDVPWAAPIYVYPSWNRVFLPCAGMTVDPLATAPATQWPVVVSD